MLHDSLKKGGWFSYFLMVFSLKVVLLFEKCFLHDAGAFAHEGKYQK